MSVQFLRILIAGALLVHGIGHSLGYWKPAQSLFFIKVSKPALKIIGGVVWTLVILGFILSALSFYGLLVPFAWWKSLVVVFAIISLVGLLLFGRSWPMFNFLGAFVFNIVILVSLLWLQWLPIELLNAK